MKKTFVFYNDWIDYTIEMSLEEKGLFLQTILKYQNGEDLGDIGSIKYIWVRIKNQLDEDNNKWSEEREKRSKAGIEGNKKRWEDDRKLSQVIASATSSSQLIADNVNVNVNVNDNVNDNINKIKISSKEDTKQVSIVEKKEYGDPIINSIIQIIKDKNNGIIDGTVANNRKYGKMLRDKIDKIKGFKGNYPGFIGMLIEKTDQYNVGKTTSCESIFYNLASLVAKIKTTHVETIQKEEESKPKTWRLQPTTSLTTTLGK